ncbi:MAG: hypothetical protein U1C96_03825, partial [Gallionella sp.]|nr:hypothetical protein [Gallionella sp.]
WNKTIDDLFNEMKAGTRRSLGSPEADWARAYEQSLLPEGIHAPCKNEVYEVLDPCEATYLTAWDGPYTGGCSVILLQGWRLRISETPRDEKPISVYAEAVDYKTVELLVVPEKDRTSGSYRGFYFSVSTLVLYNKCRLVEDNTGA